MNDPNLPAEIPPRACERCGHPTETAWAFCPMCSQPVEALPLPNLTALAHCTDVDIQELLKGVERADLVRALTDPAWAVLKARVLANLPSGARRILEDEWAYLRPDDEATAHAQRTLLRHAAFLDEEGVIRLRRENEVWVTPEHAGDFANPELEAAVAVLDEPGLQRVLRTVDKKTLTMALLAASPATRRAFYDQMSRRAVEMMEEEIREILDAVPLEELRAAQRELHDLVRTLGQEPALEEEPEDARPQTLHRISTPQGPTFEVMDLPSAQACFQDFDAVISLLDPGMALDWPPHPFHRVFEIRDGATAHSGDLEVVREILSLDFSQAQRVLVHCEVGVSRSPAMAMLLAARWGAEDKAILDGMDWARTCPNRRILELGESLLGTDGRLQALVEQGLEQVRSAKGRARAAVIPPPAEEAPARHRINLPGNGVLDVCGLPEALESYLGYDVVISLQDPWAEPAWGYHPCHWIFRVRDIEGEDEFAPSLDLVREILSLELGPSPLILVHCHEGFSRSTATGILLATKLGASREAIMNGIDWTHAYPNTRILGFGEEILGTGGALAELVEEGLRRGGWR